MRADTGDIVIRASSLNGAVASAGGNTGGLVAISEGKATTGIANSATVSVNAPVIAATGNITISADFQTVTNAGSVVDTAGLGGKPTAITEVTVFETARVNLEQSLSAAFGSINVTATGSTVASANGRADFGGFASDVTGRANLFIDTAVEVINSADLTAGTISLAARQPTYVALALSSAKADAVGAKLTSFADLNARVVVRAVSDASATLATRELSMSALAAAGAQVYAKEKTDAAFISEDVTRETNNVDSTHEVVLNSRITIIQPDVPFVLLDKTGKLTTAGGVQATVTGDRLIIADIYNTRASAGRIRLEAAGLQRYNLAEKIGKDDTVSTVGRVTGKPIVNLRSSLTDIIIRNETDRLLSIGNIYPAGLSVNGIDSVVVIAADTSGFSLGDTVYDTGPTNIRIESRGDVEFRGRIDNARIDDKDPYYGTVSVAGLGGNDPVYAGRVTTVGDARIEAQRLTVDAASITGAGGGLNLLADTVSARSYLGDLDLRTSGTLTVERAASARDLRLTAGQSLLNAANGESASGRAVVLKALSGDIGSRGSAFRFDQASTFIFNPNFATDLLLEPGAVLGTLVAEAGGSAYLSETNGGSVVERLTAGGTASLSTAAQATRNNAILLQENGRITAGSAVVLAAAGDVKLAETGSFITAPNITIALANVVEARDIWILGDLDDAARKTIVGNSNNNKVTLLDLNGITEVQGQDGNDEVILGRGLLTGLTGTLLFDGGAGNDDQIVLRDESATTNRNITVDAGLVTGIGTSATLGFTNLEILQYRLGSGDDLVKVRSLEAGLRFAFYMGRGNDTAIVSGTDGTLDRINEVIRLDGGTGTGAKAAGEFDRLIVSDAGDRDNNAFQIGNSRIIGGGMTRTPGASNPDTVLDDDAGINYSNFDRLDFSAGSGDDLIAITGADTLMQVSAGAGNDTFRLGPVVGEIANDLNLFGDIGSDTVEVIGGDVTGNRVALGRDQAGRTTIITSNFGAVDPNLTTLNQMERVKVRMGAAGDRVEIDDVALPTDIDTGAGSDDIVIRNLTATGLATIRGGAGRDTITIINTQTDLVIGAEGGDEANDNVIFDRSASTNALSARIADAANGAVAVTGLSTGTVTLAGVGAVEVRLGKSDDQIEVATAANASAIALLTVIGNEGADTLKATALGGLKLDYYGDYGPSVLNPGGSAILGTRNTAVVVIPNEPKPNDFVNLGLNQVTALTVDNRQNGSVAVNWRVREGRELFASVRGSNYFSIVNLNGADFTEILGGSKADTLDFLVDQNGSFDVKVESDRVKLSTDVNIVSQAQTKTEYRSLPPFALTFDGLSGRYSEIGNDALDPEKLTGMRLKTEDGSANIAATVVGGSPAVQATAGTNLVIAGKNAFAMYG